MVRIKWIIDLEQPLQTQSRMVLSYAVTVTDDDSAVVEKPFQFYSYRGADGRRLIASVAQPYMSEG